MEYIEENGLFFDSRTNAIVRRELSRAFNYKYRVRVYYGNIETGQASPEEYDIMGKISRSTGKIKIPLLINNSRSLGGIGLLDHIIIAIQDTEDKNFYYRHPKFNVGEWAIIPADIPDYLESVTLNGSIHARFRKPGQAQRYIEFMQGLRMKK